MVALILLGSLLALVLAVIGAQSLGTAAGNRRQVVAAVIGDDVYGGLPPLERYDRLFRATRVGRRLERELALAGVRHRPVVVFAVGVLVAVMASIVLWTLLAPLFGIVGAATGVLALRSYLSRERTRRQEAFIAQMPELSRVLANATNAGLSIHTAIGVASEELDEPASTEMRRVSTAIGFGAGLDAALAEMSERLPSREVAVLTATLVVSSRSGGSLVSALRDIADTLETRKETRREIRTTMAQALATGYLVIGMGGFILIVLNGLYPGVVEKMTITPIGQIALLSALVLYGGGLVLIRRMTRFEL